jgi:hypothetical protein
MEWTDHALVKAEVLGFTRGACATRVRIERSTDRLVVDPWRRA